jgi:hypothetical protein
VQPVLFGHQALLEGFGVVLLPVGTAGEAAGSLTDRALERR